MLSETAFQELIDTLGARQDAAGVCAHEAFPEVRDDQNLKEWVMYITTRLVNDGAVVPFPPAVEELEHALISTLVLGLAYGRLDYAGPVVDTDPEHTPADDGFDVEEWEALLMGLPIPDDSEPDDVD